VTIRPAANRCSDAKHAATTHRTRRADPAGRIAAG
jgi:hypothetical protein